MTYSQVSLNVTSAIMRIEDTNPHIFRDSTNYDSKFRAVSHLNVAVGALSSALLDDDRPWMETHALEACAILYKILNQF